ncbi:hypothetical protein E4U55_005594 [Claviceps digitariae]|nr:hypothetical protein E4U55_005594 [Claviceps digitariae]
MARDPSRRPMSQTQTQTQTQTGEPDEAAPDETTRILSPAASEHANYQTLNGNGTGTPPPPPMTTTPPHPKQAMHRRATSNTSPAAAAAAEANQPGREAPARDGDGAMVSWLRGRVGYLRSVELENKGSVARDHLALERTFLAWLRTSLAFASIGIAVTQLFRLNTTLSDNHGHGHSHNATIRRLGRPLGATFLGISILTLLLGARRYFVGQAWVIQGKFPASRGTVIIVAVVALAIMLVSLVVVIVIHPPESDEL